MDYLLIRLLNSAHGKDRLDDPEWVKKFISGLDIEFFPSRQNIEALKELRVAMMNIIEASGAGNDPAEKDIEMLRKALGGVLFHYGFDSTDSGNERNRSDKISIDGEKVFVSDGSGDTISIDGDSVFISDGSGDTISIDGDKVTVSKADKSTARRRRYSIFPVPEKKDFSWVMQAVAMSFAEVLASDSLYRMKICANPDCRWVFFDESKNASRKWCEDACGSLIKMREFRKRQAEKKDRE